VNRRDLYLRILKAQVELTGIQGEALKEVWSKLEQTETSVLEECVRRGAVDEAITRVRKGLS
jgi:hypothetical protein